MANENSTPQRYVAKLREMPEVYHITSADPVSIRDYDYTFAPNPNGEYDLYAWVEVGEDGTEKVIVQEGERFRKIWRQEDPSQPCQECVAWAACGEYCALHAPASCLECGGYVDRPGYKYCSTHD